LRLAASALALAVVACGQKRTPDAGEAASNPVQDASIADAPIEAEAPRALASLDELAATRTAGMREWHRAEIEVHGKATVPLPEPERDVCVRVAVAASRPIEVAVAGTRQKLASGLAPEDGVACLRKGEKAEIVAEGDASARLVVFRTP
jgi:hypothetical protein